MQWILSVFLGTGLRSLRFLKGTQLIVEKLENREINKEEKSPIENGCHCLSVLPSIYLLFMQYILYSILYLGFFLSVIT